MVVFPPRGGVKLKKKFNLRAAALLCTMAISSLSAYSDDISSFDKLKEAITKEEETSVNVTGDVQFESALSVKSKKEVSGQDASSASFSPKDPPSPAESPYVAPAFNVDQAGDLTLKNLTVKNFGDGVEKSVINNSGKLTIGPNVTFQDCKSNTSPGGRPYPQPGGIIKN